MYHFGKSVPLLVGKMRDCLDQPVVCVVGTWTNERTS